MSVCLTVHQNKLAFAGVFDTSRKVWTIISRKFGIYIYTYVGAVLRQQCRSSWSFLKWNLTSTIIYKQQRYLAVVVVQKALGFFWNRNGAVEDSIFLGNFCHSVELNLHILLLNNIYIIYRRRRRIILLDLILLKQQCCYLDYRIYI